MSTTRARPTKCANYSASSGVTHWGCRQGHAWRTEAWLLNNDGTERPALKWLRCYIAGESGWDALVPEYVSAGWSGGASGVKLEAEIEEWIRDYCARYPDTQMIDVVNEATPGHAPTGYAQSAFGNDWIIRSFQLARQYCPNATLILSDYNVLSWNTQEFIDMARPAVEAGVVDAIGLQAHGLEDWSLNDLQSKLDVVAALGLPIYISEYDVDHADDQRQLQIMQEQFPMFFSHPSVAGITLWGYVVGGTWVPNSGLIRSDGTHRPAMTWLMNFLER